MGFARVLHEKFWSCIFCHRPSNFNRSQLVAGLYKSLASEFAESLQLHWKTSAFDAHLSPPANSSSWWDLLFWIFLCARGSIAQNWVLTETTVKAYISIYFFSQKGGLINWHFSQTGNLVLLDSDKDNSRVSHHSGKIMAEPVRAKP